MRIFVTGAAGFIGQATMTYGREQGHEMIGCDVDARGVAGVTQGCVTDADFLLRQTAGCDAIIHLATVHTGHLKKGLSHEEFYRINVIGSDNLFRAALAHGIKRFVYASSLDIHCGTNADWAHSGALRYTEATPDLPNSYYALSKLMVEKMGHFYHDVHDIKFCAMRYVYIYLSCSDPAKLDPVSLASRITVREDCAEANLLACTSDRVEDDVLLIGPDNRMRNEHLVRSITDLEGVMELYWPGSVETFKAAGFPISGALWPACDITRAKQVLGWRPRYDCDWLLSRVHDGLRR